MKFLNFFSIFALLDPHPDPESGSTDLIESGSETLFLTISYIKRCLFGLNYVDYSQGSGRIHVCHVCAKKFVTASTLNSHIKLVHK